jgi:hypothetical protein
VETFHDPSAWDEIGFAFRFGDLIATRTNVRDVSTRGDVSGLPDVSCVEAEVLDRRLVGGTGHPRVQQFAVMTCWLR